MNRYQDHNMFPPDSGTTDAVDPASVGTSGAPRFVDHKSERTLSRGSFETEAFPMSNAYLGTNRNGTYVSVSLGQKMSVKHGYEVRAGSSQADNQDGSFAIWVTGNKFVAQFHDVQVRQILRMERCRYARPAVEQGVGK
jgi:hypothetical protein